MRTENVRALPVPPHSVESEQAVLGSLMLEPGAWPRIAGKIEGADFYRADHRLIFAAARKLLDEGQPADAVTVSEALAQSGQATETGGLQYLAKLVRETPTAANIEAYASVVRDRAGLRRLSHFSERMARAVHDPEGRSSADLIASALEALNRMQSGARIGKGLIDSKQLIGELIDDLDRRRSGARGLAIGLPDFDRLTCGLESGDLVVLAGRPGMGKTALLVSIAHHVSPESGVAVFSAEMPAQQLMRRCLSLATSIPQGRLRRAEKLVDDDWERIGRATTPLSRRQLWIDDTPSPSLTHIRAETWALKARSRLGLVLIDYVQLVQGSGTTRYEQLRDVAYGLKSLAKELSVPVIVLAQLNRGVENRERKRPHASDLRDSGAIEEAADIIGLLYSEGYYDRSFPMPHVLECELAKNRNGERGECLWSMAGEFSMVSTLDEAERARYRKLQAAPPAAAARDF